MTWPRRQTTRARQPARVGKRIAAAAVAVTFLAAAAIAAEPAAGGRLAPGSRPAEAGPPTEWRAGIAPDYAPSGMPDFSQCRGAWSVAGDPGQWTHAGPVALAAALWWLDSVAEPGSDPPPAVSDGHGLVTAYPVFGPPRDDHAPENLEPLVNDLALRAGTNAVRQSRAWRGTRWEDLTQAAESYVRSRRMEGHYAVHAARVPSTAWLLQRAAAGAAVVLALGVWEDQAAGGWRRVGGHYAVVAAIHAEPAAISVSDPLADSAAFGGDGIAVPAGPAGHGCREAPRAHDDARWVSHDRYALIAGPALPDGRLVLGGYFQPETYRDAAAFAAQNPLPAEEAHAGTWSRGPVAMAVDAALAVVPVGTAVAPTAVATGTPSPTPESSPESSPAGTLSPTASGTASATGGGPEPSVTSSAATPRGTLAPQPGATSGTRVPPATPSPTLRAPRRNAVCLPLVVRPRQPLVARPRQPLMIRPRLPLAAASCRWHTGRSTAPR